MTDSAEQQDDEAVIQGAISKATTFHFQAEQMKVAGRLLQRVRELAKTIDGQGQATNALTERIRKLNVWLLLVTIAIGALTVVQVAIALKWACR
jgi:phage-related protein